MPQRQRDERDRIRAIFLNPQTSYSLVKVPDLVGITPEDVLQAVQQGVLSPAQDGDDLRVSWEDVVALGLERRWTLRMLTEALQDDEVPTLPHSIRVVSGRALLPRYQWQLLRWLAAQQSRQESREITPSDLLEEAVDAAMAARGIDWKEVETVIPAIRAALAWPAADD